MDLEDKILQATMEVFNEKGAKFTMDDVCKSLLISKKTIYTVYKDKVSLLRALIEYGFDGIKDAERKVIEDESLSTLEKLRRITIVLPQRLNKVDFSKFHTIKEKYPKLFAEIEERIESDWDLTLTLLQKGVEEGVIRPISINVLKSIIEASIERFLDEGVEGHDYRDALEIMMEIITKGIEKRD